MEYTFVLTDSNPNFNIFIYAFVRDLSVIGTKLLYHHIFIVINEAGSDPTFL